MDVIISVSMGALAMAIVKAKDNTHLVVIEYGQHKVEIPLNRARYLVDGLSLILKDYI